MNKFERDLYSPWNVDITEKWDDVDIFSNIFDEREPIKEHVAVLNAGILNEYAYSRYKNVINPVDSAWWLKTEDWTSGTVRCVERSGQIGAISVEHAIGVRPYCVVQFESVVWPGERVEFAGLNWTVLESWRNKAFVLCDDIVARRPFSYNRKGWATSELRSWVEEWLEDLSI